MRTVFQGAQQLIYLSFLLCICFFNTEAQDCATPYKAFDCPQYPSYGSFNRDCFIKCDYPSGELLLPQGGVDGLNGEEPMHVSIPSNRVTWALGIAHAWNYTRNIIKSQDHPKISLWMGITARETGMSCDCGAVWPDGKTPWTTKGDHFNTKCNEGITQTDGCFQMEFHNGWCGLSQTWPLRFRGPDHTYYDENIALGNFETSALGFAYRCIENHYVADYMLGYDILDLANGAADPFLYEKLMASGWNGWAGSVQNNLTTLYGKMCDPATRAAGKAIQDWQYLYSAERSYSNQVGYVVSVLERDSSAVYYKNPIPQITTQASTDINHQFYGYYNENITWTHIEEYLTNISSFYHELTAAEWTTLKTAVKAIYDPIATANGGSVPFRKLGPVMDEIIMQLPMENPMVAAINNPSLPGFNNGTRKCIGFEAPASHIELETGYQDEVCLGQSFILNSVIDGGDGPNVTYQWYRNGVAIAGETGKSLTVVPTTTGVFEYSAEVYNPDLGGRAHPDCPKVITVNQCAACGITATKSNPVNTPCENMQEGSITINVTGSTNYTIKYTGETTGEVAGSGASTVVSGLKDGVYNFEVIDAVDPNCKTYLTHEVNYDTPLKDDLVASVSSLADCNATLQADIVLGECECDWTVGVQAAPGYAFEEDLKFRITPSNGGPNMAYKSRDNSNDGKPVEYTFSMCSGGIVVDLIVTAASGWCVDGGTVNQNLQNFPYQVYLKDENGTQITLIDVPIGTGKQGEFIQVANFANLTCPFTPNTYTYQWSPDGGNQATANVAKATTADIIYTVTATSTANTQCKLTDTVLVPFRCGDTCVAPNQAQIMANATSICPADSVNLTANQLAGYEYTWYRNGAEVINGLEEYNYSGPAGVYVLVIADSLLPSDSSCMALDTITILNDPTPNLNLGKDTTLCFGDSLVLTASGFTSYSWNGTNAGTDSTFVVKTSGQVVLVAANATGCSSADTINIIVNDELDFSLGNDTSICLGDSILIVGPSNMVSYNWNGGGASQQNQLSISTSSNTSLEVVDSNGCTANDTILLTVNNLPSVDLGADSTFCVDSIQLFAGDGFVTYEWNNGVILDTTSSIFVSSSGTYKVEVEDANGCMASDSVNLVKTSGTTVALGNDTTLCFGDSISLDAGTGFVSYLWQDGSTNTTLQLKQSQTAWVEVEDANGCVSSDTLIVNVLSDESFSLGNDTSLCFGDSVLVQAPTGFESYLWSSGGNQNSLVVNTSGVYFLDVSAQGCSFSDTISVTIFSDMLIDLNGTDTLSICPGSSVQLSANLTNGQGAVQYLWEDLSVSHPRTVSTAGQYSIQVIDSAGCVANDTIEVVVSNSLSVVLNNATICPDSSLLLDCGYDANNYTIAWGPNGETTQTIQASIANDYHVVVSDQNGCSGTDTMTLSVHAAPSVSLGNDTTICVGDSVVLGAGVFNSFVWNTNQQTREITVSEGSYVVSATDMNGCVATDTVNVSVVGAPLINGVLKDKALCAGVDVLFDELRGYNDGNGPYSFTWQDASSADTFKINNLASSSTVIQNGGLVHVTIMNSFGCSASDSATVSITPGLAVSLTSSDLDNKLCEGDSLILSEPNYSIENGFNFTWSNGANGEALLVTAGGTYTLEVEKDGCLGRDSIVVTVFGYPEITLEDSAMFCSGDSVLLSANVVPVNAALAWGNPSVQDGLNLMVNTGGTYEVFATLDSVGCTTSAQIVVEEIGIPVFSFDRDSVKLCDGETATLSINTSLNNVTYLWSGGSVSEELTVTSTGSHSLTLITDQANCRYSDTINTVFVEVPEITLVSDTIICEGTDAVLFAESSIIGSSFKWSTLEQTQGILVNTSGIYTVEVSNEICSASASTTVSTVEKPISDLDHTVEEGYHCFEDARGISLSVANDPNYTYNWQMGSTIVSDKNSALAERGGIYTVTISSKYCPDVVDQVTITEFCPTGVYIPNALLPFSTIEENTTFGVHGNVDAEKFNLMVFNRWGELIYESSNPTKFWDGKYKGNYVQQDVYVWKVEYLSNQLDSDPILKSVIGRVTVLY